MKRFLILITLLLISCSEEEKCRDFPEFNISDAYEITDNSAKADFEIFKPNCESIYYEVSQGIVYNYNPNRLTPETGYDIENFNNSFTEEIRGTEPRRFKDAPERSDADWCKDFYDKWGISGTDKRFDGTWFDKYQRKPKV